MRGMETTCIYGCNVSRYCERVNGLLIVLLIALSDRRCDKSESMSCGGCVNVRGMDAWSRQLKCVCVSVMEQVQIF